MHDTMFKFLVCYTLFPSKGNARVDEVISFGVIAILPSCKIFGTRQDHQKFEM
jgi:hypothetical protein